MTDTGKAVIELSPNALKVLQRRYLKKGENGEALETPEEMFRRVARAIAQAERLYNPAAPVEEWEDTFYRLMTSLEFLPNTPTLMNAGRELQQLSACFVLPVDDCMESIFERHQERRPDPQERRRHRLHLLAPAPEERPGQAHHGRGQRAGLVHARVRHRHRDHQAGRHPARRQHGHPARRPSGHPRVHPRQGRRGHPQQLQHLGGRHRGVHGGRAQAGEDYALRQPARPRESGQKLNAREVFDLIVDLAWKNGEPGIVFLDRINRGQPDARSLGEIECTNPCGEQPLLPYESCNLGSINLSRMVKDGARRLRRARARGHAPPCASSTTSSTSTGTRCPRSSR